MRDFQTEIDRLQREHTESELCDMLSERVDGRPTSFNPLTEAVFDRIAPDEDPIAYAQRSADYDSDLQPVDKKALGLKMLLHERIGRPPRDSGGKVTPQDIAECIVAIDAHDEGIQPPDDSTSTELPPGVDELVDAPGRTTIPDGPFDPLIRLTNGYEQRIDQWLDEHPDIAEAPYAVYVVDCTPPVSDTEPEPIRKLRREAATRRAADITAESRSVVDQAAQALNREKLLYYVGSTNNLAKRINEHVTGAGLSGIAFTHRYTPQQLVRVDGYESEREAKRQEGKLARKLNSHDNIFAYSDEM